MSRLLDKGLEQLTTILLKMGDMAEKTIRIAIMGFMNGTDVGDETRELSETLLAMTVSVEDKAFELMIKYQPVASDLRIINSYMKIAYDFERYGRYALDITLTQRRFAASQKCVYSRDLLEKMAEKVVLMVHTSVDALKSNDGEMAKSLANIENEVDAIYSEYLDKLSKAPSGTKCLISTTLVVRYLERIADHATYVGESIYYIATGQKILLR
ncbi:MAG TPA: phosphate signaling complex protein PhoU [Candidatus Krumholzibacteriaceae bacterium]|jgi:phosphate transport system protein|nr:phosphate signaling complex protein PhoU [Candidatus Krumholzibacteriaceae bacterium]